MLNKIWFWLVVVGIVYGLGKSVLYQACGWPTVDIAAAAVETPIDTAAATNEPIDDGATNATVPSVRAADALSTATIDAANVAVEICLGLIGVMVLWMGLLNVARDAGMVDTLARLLRPLMRWLFPDVPDGHPAQGAILMNVAANMMGLDNAATPFGLKAMRELQTLNPTDDTATNAMATFLAINTSNVTLLPITIIALRAAADSHNIMSPLGGIILATTISTIVAVIAVRTLQRLPRYAVHLPPT